jgi:hypothetical protein
LLSELLGKLFDQPVFESNKLIFKRKIAIFSHVLSYNELLDSLILGLEIFKSKLLEAIQHFIVFSCVLHNCFDFSRSCSTKNLALRISGERTGDRKVWL